jgi:hypothetical protein
MQSSIWSVLWTGTTRLAWVRVTDPRALEIADRCGFDSGCAMTGDAKTAMPAAATITFKLVFIISLKCFLSPQHHK